MENKRMNRRGAVGEDAEDFLEGRNAVAEALKSGRTLDKVYVASGDTDRALARLAAQAREAGAAVVQVERRRLPVDCPPQLLAVVPEDKREALLGILAEDPRPAYQRDPQRVYGLTFAGLEVRFTVAGETLTVCEVQRGM